MNFTILSPAFKPNTEIPILYTGEGKNISPPLSFFGTPEKTQSLVLIVDDPDAPDPAAPQRTFVHWVLYNLPPTTKSFEEDIIKLPGKGQSGLNDRDKLGYTGPMPPIGRHRYFFKLYALDNTLSFAASPHKADIEAAMKGHVVAEAELVGTYQSKKP